MFNINITNLWIMKISKDTWASVCPVGLIFQHHAAAFCCYTQNLTMKFKIWMNLAALKVWKHEIRQSPGEAGQKSTRDVSASGHLGSHAETAKQQPSPIPHHGCELWPRNLLPKPLPSSNTYWHDFLVRCKLDKSWDYWKKQARIKETVYRSIQ